MERFGRSVIASAKASRASVIVFLVDAAAGDGPVRDLVTRQWRRMRQNSPNLRSAGRVKIYMAEEGDRGDAQAVMDLLMDAASFDAGPDLEGVSPQATPPEDDGTQTPLPIASP